MVVRLQNKGEVVGAILLLCVIVLHFCSNSEKTVQIGIYFPTLSQH